MRGRSPAAPFLPALPLPPPASLLSLSPVCSELPDSSKVNRKLGIAISVFKKKREDKNVGLVWFGLVEDLSERNKSAILWLNSASQVPPASRVAKD